MANRAWAQLGPPAALPVTFHLDGTAYTLPAGDTRGWLRALSCDPPSCWLALIPGALPGPEFRELTDRMLDPEDSFDLDDLEHVAESVLGSVCGLELYAACALARCAYGNWLLFDGWCASVGFDPLTQPIGRLLAAVYSWRRSLCQETADLSRLDAEIWVGPPALTVSGAERDAAPPSWDDEAEAAAFLATMSALGGARGHGG